MILQAALLIVVLFLLFYSALWLVLVGVGAFYNPKRSAGFEGKCPSILVVLPAYRPGNIFFQAMENLKKAIGNQPIKVLAVFQHADPKFEEKARSHGFMTMNHSVDQVKGNSYHHVLKLITDQIDQMSAMGVFNPSFTMILDKDNLIDKDFFDNIPSEAFKTYDIIQGCRKALSVGNSTSFFDHISETLNDLMFRAAPSILGTGVEISGSGALIRTEIFKDCLRNLDPNAPGYDKNFMVQLLSRFTNHKAVYLPECVVHEEKTADAHAFGSQRVRWFGEQYYNAVFSAPQLMKAGVTKANVNPLLYLICLWRPPRSLHILLAGVFAGTEVGYFLLSGGWLLSTPLASIGLVCTALALTIVVWKAGVSLEQLTYITKLPALAWSNTKSAVLSLLPGNRRTFIHTDHKL